MERHKTEQLEDLLTLIASVLVEEDFLRQTENKQAVSNDGKSENPKIRAQTDESTDST